MNVYEKILEERRSIDPASSDKNIEYSEKLQRKGKCGLALKELKQIIVDKIEFNEYLTKKGNINEKRELEISRLAEIYFELEEDLKETHLMQKFPVTYLLVMKRMDDELSFKMNYAATQGKDRALALKKYATQMVENLKLAHEFDGH